jgi:hypothetical protein
MAEAPTIVIISADDGLAKTLTAMYSNVFDGVTKLIDLAIRDTIVETSLSHITERGETEARGLAAERAHAPLRRKDAVVLEDDPLVGLHAPGPRTGGQGPLIDPR